MKAIIVMNIFILRIYFVCAYVQHMQKPTFLSGKGAWEEMENSERGVKGLDAVLMFAILQE